MIKKILPTAIFSSFMSVPVMATTYEYNSIPSVIVTVENSAPSRGAFQTPFWVGAHDGSFNIYNRNAELGVEGTVPAPAVERLAEDGNTGPITEAFDQSNGLSPQATLVGPSGPLAPGDKVSYTLNVNPEIDRYFSYASMVIPSNDAFIANGNPKAHELFNERGHFVGRTFVVTGSEVLDGGTEANDEVASNTAFLNQAAPDTGVIENGPVVLHPGFAERGALDYADGVLNYPAFGLADFTALDYRVATFKFRYVDLANNLFFRSNLNARQEVGANLVESRGRGHAFAVSRNAEVLNLKLVTRGLTGKITALHLHNAASGNNGPVVVNLTDQVKGNRLHASIRAEDVLGSLGSTENPMVSLLNEVTAGNIYINVHTEQNPAGEIRGQLKLQRK